MLRFPSVTALAEFILLHQVHKATTNTSEKLLTASLAEEHIAIACRQYGARIQKEGAKSLHR